MKKEERDALTDDLSSMDSTRSVKFMEELETSGSIPFLDALIFCKEDVQDVYRYRCIDRKHTETNISTLIPTTHWTISQESPRHCMTGATILSRTLWMKWRKSPTWIRPCWSAGTLGGCYNIRVWKLWWLVVIFTENALIMMSEKVVMAFMK